jgi:hypothetical protein
MSWSGILENLNARIIINPRIASGTGDASIRAMKLNAARSMNFGNGCRRFSGESFETCVKIVL